MILATLVAWLTAIWARFSYYIVMIGAGILALLVAFSRGRSAGKRVYREKHEKANRKAAERAIKIKDKIRSAGDEEVSRRLDRWYRD